MFNEGQKLEVLSLYATLFNGVVIILLMDRTERLRNQDCLTVLLNNL